ARCSTTIRTARSRTSGENLLVVLLITDAPSHKLEPPGNPGRFRSYLLGPRGRAAKKEKES
ncbi:hypothetical protein KRZ98_18165, partial [Sphingobium sp. AS12]|uniref:hypothetical protein n=1 Tax=Sphingobium sp. AS12 TaxID=2849495 RepID=UPI001C31202F